MMASNSLFSNHPSTLAYGTEQLKELLNKPTNNKYTRTNSMTSIDTNLQIGSVTDQIMYHYRQEGIHLKQKTTITVSVWDKLLLAFVSTLILGCRPRRAHYHIFLFHDLLTAELLLVLARTVIIGSESHGTHDDTRGLISLWLYEENKLRD
jgi:hypothetical protein